MPRASTFAPSVELIMCGYDRISIGHRSRTGEPWMARCHAVKRQPDKYWRQLWHKGACGITFFQTDSCQWLQCGGVYITPRELDNLYRNIYQNSVNISISYVHMILFITLIVTRTRSRYNADTRDPAHLRRTEAEVDKRLLGSVHQFYSSKLLAVCGSWAWSLCI